MLVVNVLNPIMTKKKTESEELYQEYLKKVFQYFCYAGIFFSLLIFLFSDFIINILYGEEFFKAAAVLKIYVFTNVFIYLGIAQNVWIINENKGKVNIYKTASGVVASIIANIILIPMYGIIGAAYAAVIVQFISSFLINIIIAPYVFKLQLYSFFNKL